MAGKASRSVILTYAAAIGVVLSLLGCAEDPEPIPVDEKLAIDLRWIRSFPQERRSEVETGLLWTLSFLGAALPPDGPSPLRWQDDVVTLRLEHAGIGPEVLDSWTRLLDAMKASDEYQATGAIDVGRFVALTLCSTHHYYALTGANASYDAARAERAFDAKTVAIVESSVATGNRLIEVAQGSSLGDIAFVAHEGVGSLRQESFRVVERELLDVMPNGQLRFALYDLNGSLKPAASETLTAAGKPSKCLWCHETELSRAFDARTSVEGYYSLRAFTQQLSDRTEVLHSYRTKLRSRIDFSRKQDHTYAELLYLAFYEPSAERIAREWNVPVERVRGMLSESATHAQAEFPILGDELYTRADVDVLAPYVVVEVPTDPREPSEYEPDLIH